MDKKELQKAQNIIDALFYDDKALTQWQHTLLENVISITQTKLRQPDVSGRSELLIALQNIEKICENQNPTHEQIWRIAYEAINSR